MRAAPEIRFRKTVTIDRVFQWHRMGRKIYLCDIFNLFNYLSLSHHGKMTTVFKSEIKWLHSKPNWNYEVMSEHSEFWHDSNISGDFKRDWAKGPLSSSWFMITYLSFQKSLRMKLEPIIQSEISQKDKDHYNILTHIYGIYKDVNDNPICKTEKETQMYRTVF